MPPDQLTASPAALRVAAVDIGSTSVHLLVADVSDVSDLSDGSNGAASPAPATGDESGPSAGANRSVVTSVLDASAILALGSRIEADGIFGPAVRAELAETLAIYADEARRLGAIAIAFAGTDPLRHAGDAARACTEIEARSGVPVHVLDQAEEGALTLLGVTEGRPAGELAVIDVGGGSTEIIVAGPDGIRQIVGLPIGASRLTAAVGAEDPPTARDVTALRSEARRILEQAPDLRLDAVVAVGGTAFGLARVASGPAPVVRLLNREGLRLAIALTAAERSAHVAELFGLNPRRSRILPAGAAIVSAIFDRYGLERMSVSEAGIREGLVIALARDGHAWRDRAGVAPPGIG